MSRIIITVTDEVHTILELFSISSETESHAELCRKLISGIEDEYEVEHAGDNDDATTR